MLKETMKKLRTEFGFLAEEQNEVEQNIMNRLDRSVKLDEVDTITFGLETDDGKIVKVYVKVDQADDFEKALSDKLGEIDDIEEVLNELSKEYEIVDVEWPTEDAGTDDEAADNGSSSLNQQVYDNPKEKAETAKDIKPKMEALTVGEQFTIDINEESNPATIENRFTTAAQLMVYHAILELGVPEMALSRSAYRASLMKNIKAKALELQSSPTMKNALKMFINKSIDYDKKAESNKEEMAGGKKNVKESLTEGVTQDFWNAFLELVNYVAATPEDAKDLLANQAMKQIMSRSSASITSNVSAQIKTKLVDFKNALSNDGKTNQLKAVGVAEAYSRAADKLTEGATQDEISTLFNDLLSLADSSKDKSVASNVLQSSAWNSYWNAAKVSLSQKFGGTTRAKLNQLKSVLPKATAAEPAAPTAGVKTESKLFAAALKTEAKSLKNATLAHSYKYGSESFDEGHPVEVIGEEGDSYILKAFPIMANGHMKLKKTAVKLVGKIKVPVGGNNGRMPGGLNEQSKPGNTDWYVLDVQKKQILFSEISKDQADKLAANKKNLSVFFTRDGIFYSENESVHYRGTGWQDLSESQVPEWTYEMEDENVVIQCANLKVILNDEEVEKLVKGITNKDTVIVRDEEDPTHKVAFSPRGSSIMVKKVGTPEGIMMKMKDVETLLDFVSKGEEVKPDEEQEADAAEPKEDEKK